MNAINMQEISEKIYKDHTKRIDDHLFNWLSHQGFAVPRNRQGVESFFKKMNFELVRERVQTEDGEVVTYKLTKIIMSTTILLKKPVITIDGKNITI